MPTPPRRDKSARPDSTLRTSKTAPARAGRATVATPSAASPRSAGTPTGRRPAPVSARNSAARPGEPRRDAGSPGGPGSAEPIPRQRLEVDARRAQLVALGIELFSTRPYEEVRIDEVADAAGVSKGLLYHYFPTKRDFYVATLREAAGALLAETADDAPEAGGVAGAASGTGTAPLSRLHRGLHKYLSFAERYATAYLALMRGGAGADAAVVQLIESTRTEFMERLIAGVQAGLAADHALSEALTGRSAATGPQRRPLSLKDQPALLRVALRGWIGYVEAASLEWLVTLGHAPSLAKTAAAAPARPASRDALVDLLIALLLAALRAAA